jgi:hypothetical protein
MTTTTMMTTTTTMTMTTATSMLTCEMTSNAHDCAQLAPEKPSFLLRPLKVSTSDAPVFTPMAMQATLTPRVTQCAHPTSPETECRQRVSMTLRSVLAQLHTRLLPSTDAVAAASDVVCVAAARLAEHLLSLSVRPGEADARITPHATANCSAQLLGALLRGGASVRELCARLVRANAARRAAARRAAGDVDRVTLLVDALIECSRAVPPVRDVAGELMYMILPLPTS